MTAATRPVTLSVVAGRSFRIVICRGPECGDRRGSAVLHDAFRAALAGAPGTSDSPSPPPVVEVAWQSCFGRCTQGPNVLVREILTAPPGGLTSGGFATLPGPRGVTALYNRMEVARVERVVTEHVNRGQVVREFIERPGIHPADPLASRTKDS